jgi:O-antigen/teichoic acid export membrane protein
MVAGAISGGLAMIVMRLSGLVAVPLLLGLLGLKLYGIWAIASTLMGGQVLLDLGASAVGARFLAEAERDDDGPAARRVLSVIGLWYLGTGLAVGGAIAAAAGPIALAVGATGSKLPPARTLLAGAGFLFAVSNVAVALTSALQGLQRLMVVGAAAAAGQVVYVVWLAAAVALNAPITAVIWATLSLYVTQIAILVPGTLRHMPRGPGHKGGPTLRQMVRFGGTLQVGTSADFVAAQLPKVAAGLLLGPVPAAGADLAMRIPTMAAGFATPLLPPLLPAVARLNSDPQPSSRRQLIDLYELSSRYLSILLALAFTVVMLAGPAFLRLWIGSSARGLTSPTRLFAAALLALSLGGVASTWALGTGRPSVIVGSKLSILGVAIPGAVLLAPALGLSGVAIAFAVGNGLGLVTLLFGCERMLERQERWQSVRPLLRPALSFALGIAVGAAFEAWGTRLEWGHGGMVEVCAAGIGLAVALSALVIWRAVTLTEVRLMLGRRHRVVPEQAQVNASPRVDDPSGSHAFTETYGV